ncbi:NirD/YgiW/YdeI family stress tolerance protein, partial [Acinetobacter baumannii]
MKMLKVILMTAGMATAGVVVANTP